VKATPTGTPAAEPAPASLPEPPPPPAAPPTSDQIIAQAQPSTALALLATLEVKGRAPKTGYDRDLFGQAWADTDVSARQLQHPTLLASVKDALSSSGLAPERLILEITETADWEATPAAGPVAAVVPGARLRAGSVSCSSPDET
jgi:hypothetical protein